MQTKTENAEPGAAASAHQVADKIYRVTKEGADMVSYETALETLHQAFLGVGGVGGGAGWGWGCRLFGGALLFFLVKIWRSFEHLEIFWEFWPAFWKRCCSNIEVGSSVIFRFV